MIGSTTAAVIAIVVFGIIITQKLERVVLVAERTEEKLDGVLRAASPVGRAALEKGIQVMENVDEDALARSAEQGVKEVGSAAKGKLLEWVNSQNASPENNEIPNLDITIQAGANTDE